MLLSFILDRYEGSFKIADKIKLTGLKEKMTDALQLPDSNKDKNDINRLKEWDLCELVYKIVREEDIIEPPTPDINSAYNMHHATNLMRVLTLRTCKMLHRLWQKSMSGEKMYILPRRY